MSAESEVLESRDGLSVRRDQPWVMRVRKLNFCFFDLDAVSGSVSFRTVLANGFEDDDAATAVACDVDAVPAVFMTGCRYGK